MKKIAILLSALVIATVLVFGPGANTPAVYAQATCLDAAGAPVPCPPTEEPSTGGGGSDDNSGGGSQPGGGNPNPPSVVTATPSATPTPLPTNTPLPVKDKPTENPTKNAPSEVTPTPTSELVIASNDPSADPNPEPGIPWGPIGLVAVGIVILIGLLLPAVQKFANKPKDPSPQTREHVLLAKQDSEQGKSRTHRLFGDADGDSPPPPPPPPPQNNTPAEEDGMQLKGKRAEVAPQTREHILLANAPTDPSEAKSKPKPPPPPPPPPGGSPGGFDKEITIESFRWNTNDSSQSASPPFPSDNTQVENKESLTTGRDDIITREDKDKG